MTCHTYTTTNERLQDALTVVDELIGWAEADAEHASESDAPDTARDPSRREAREAAQGETFAGTPNYGGA